MQRQEESLGNDDIITSMVISIINRYRDGEVIDWSTVKNALIHNNVSLPSLSSTVTEEISNTTVAHYTDKLCKMKDRNDIGVTTFLSAAMDNERKLFEQINLPMELCKDIFRRIVESIMKDFPKDKEFAALVNEKNYDRLRDLYRLCKIGSCMNIIQAPWREYIEDEVEDFYEKQLLIGDFIELNNELIHVVTECFEAHEEMSKQFFMTLAQYLPLYPPPASGNGLKQQPILPAKMCVKSIHSKLSEVITNEASVEEVEILMQHVVEFFPYLDMDLFRQLYKSSLLRRVVQYRTPVIDAERVALSKIPDFEKKEEYLNDIEVKLETDQRWKEYLAAKKINLGMTLEVKLINYDWCKSELSELTYPKEIYSGFVDHCTAEDGYHGGIHLVYDKYTKYSTCKIVGNFAKGSKKFLVTVEQATVLLLFNDHNTLSFEEMVDKTGIGTERLKQVLFPVARSGVLVPNHKNYAEVDALQYGKEFSSVLDKFKFKTVKRKKKIHSRKHDDFRSLVKSAIVRVVMHRQRMSELDLFKEVQGQLATRASVRVRDFTTAISWLIKTEYIRRSVDDEKILEYLQ